MKTMRLFSGALAVLASAVLTSNAQPAPSFTSHYVPGVEGVKGASLPPPGFYVRDYNVFYWSSQVNDANGNDIPVDFNALVYANLIRGVWITKLEVLGGNVGMDMIVPLQYTDLSIKGTPGGVADYDAAVFGVGDLYFEPLTVSWHKPRWDAAIGFSFFAPTADSAPPPNAKPGKGFWTPMLTAGATVYLDEQKTWSFSALNRYEFNTEERDTNITPGQVWTLEWGLAKAVRPILDVGVSGYYQAQTTKDYGTGASSALDRTMAIGPEIAGVWPRAGLLYSLRFVHEIQTQDRPQGDIVTLTLTRKF